MQRGPITVERVEHHPMNLARWLSLGVEDGGELVLDQRHVPLLLDELREDVLGDALAALLLEPLERTVPEVGVPDASDQLLGSERVVPELERPHLAVLGDGLPVST